MACTVEIWGLSPSTSGLPERVGGEVGRRREKQL